LAPGSWLTICLSGRSASPLGVDAVSFGHPGQAFARGRGNGERPLVGCGVPPGSAGSSQVRVGELVTVGFQDRRSQRRGAIGPVGDSVRAEPANHPRRLGEVSGGAQVPNRASQCCPALLHPGSGFLPAHQHRAQDKGVQRRRHQATVRPSRQGHASVTDIYCQANGPIAQIADLVRPRHRTERTADQMQIRRFCVRWHRIVIAAEGAITHGAGDA
jgi:hypothetical protein